tara:strand:- start:138 stop:566 length:429 start_codon:yes stop_codon:yes gene_type:complete
MSTLVATTVVANTVKAQSGSAAPVFQDSSGTEKGRIVNAWCCIDGTGTVSYRDEFGCSTLVDNGTGDYTVNFDINFSNVNYSVACAGPVINDQGATYGWGLKHDNGGQSSAPTSKTVSSCRFQARRESDFDIDFGHIMFIGN